MQQLALILHNIRSTHNIGSIMRSADCFGVDRIYFSGYSPYPTKAEDDRLPHIANKLTKQISKTALGAEKTIQFTVHDTINDAIKSARNDGFSIAALEQDPRSIALTDYLFESPTAILLGNELDGVDEWTKSTSDVILEIAQFGTKESLNVASAAAIALFAARLKI